MRGRMPLAPGIMLDLDIGLEFRSRHHPVMIVAAGKNLWGGKQDKTVNTILTMFARFKCLR